MRKRESTLDFKRILSETIFSTSASTSERLLVGISQVLFHVLHADSGTLWLKYDAQLYCAMVFSHSLKELSHTTISDSDGLAGVVIREQRPVLLSNMAEDERSLFKDLFEKEGYSSYLGAPVCIWGENIGVLSYYLQDHHGFTRKDVCTLEFASKLVSLAIEHCAINPSLQDRWLEAFQHIATIDSLSSDENLEHKKANLCSIWLDFDDLPKGIHPITLSCIRRYLEQRKEYIDSKDVAADLDMSLSTTRRYLNYLFDRDFVEKDIIYTSVGHPTYRWRIKF